MIWIRSIVLMFVLALADLRHKWLMNACLMLALIAVAAPLMLLLGLKTGVIESYLAKLKHNPAYREMLSQPGAKVREETIRSLQSNPLVETLVRRSTASLSSVEVDSVLRGQDERPLRGLALDIDSTEGADPLLLENGIQRMPVDHPEQGFTEVVLTPDAVNELGVTGLNSGDTLQVRVIRWQNGASVGPKWQLRVIGILNPRVSPMTRLIVPLSFALDVNTYKDGGKVAGRNWDGVATPESPVCDGALLLWMPRLDDDPAAKKILSQIEDLEKWGTPQRLDEADAAKLTGLAVKVPDEGMGGLYLIPSAGARQREFNRLRGFLSEQCEVLGDPAVEVKPEGAGQPPVARCRILPWVRQRSMKLRLAAQRPEVSQAVQVSGLSIGPEGCRALGIQPPLPWSMWPGWNPTEGAPPPADRQVMLPPEMADRVGSECFLVVDGGPGMPALEVPVKAMGTSAVAGRMVVAGELAGILWQTPDVQLAYEGTSGQFLRRRASYGGFRMYARQIEDVITLQQEMGSKVKMRTHAAQISWVLDLERNLRVLFLYIAAVAGTGAIAALVFSLFGSVEGKKGDFSVMRLVGCGRLALVFFPVIQSLILSVLAYLISWHVVFGPVGHQINKTIGPHFPDFEKGQLLCCLPGGVGLKGLWLTMAISALVAVAAGLRASWADPAAALRQE